MHCWSLKLLGQLVNLCKEVGMEGVVLGPETCSTKQAHSSAFVVMTERLKRSLLILSSDNFPNSFELMNWWNSLLQGNKQFYMGRGIKLGSDVGFAIQIKKVDDPVQCGASWLQLSDMVIETETQEMAGKADGVCCSMEMKILTMLLVGPGSRLDMSIRTLMSFKVYESVFVWDGDVLQWISSKFL